MAAPVYALFAMLAAATRRAAPGSSWTAGAPIIPVAILLLDVLAVGWLRRPVQLRWSWPRRVTALLLTMEAWVVGLLLVLVTVFAFTGAFWRGGLPCMGGGCDPEGTDPTGVRGLVVAVVWGLLAVGFFRLGAWAFRRRGPRLGEETT